MILATTGHVFYHHRGRAELRRPSVLLLCLVTMQVTLGALTVLAGCNAVWFHARGSLLKLDLMARVQMLSSTAIWLAVVFCGRWIAY